MNKLQKSCPMYLLYIYFILKSTKILSYFAAYLTGIFYRYVYKTHAIEYSASILHIQQT